MFIEYIRDPKLDQKVTRLWRSLRKSLRKSYPGKKSLKRYQVVEALLHRGLESKVSLFEEGNTGSITLESLTSKERDSQES